MFIQLFSEQMAPRSYLIQNRVIKHENYDTSYGPIFHRKCHESCRQGGFKTVSSCMLCLDQRVREAHTCIKQATSRIEAVVSCISN